MNVMLGFDPRYAAQDMIHRHGLRAQAVALEHLMQQRRSGDAMALERWQAVHAVICEFRRTQLNPERADHRSGL